MRYVWGMSDKRFSPGEQAVIAILTAATLGLLGWGLRSVHAAYGLWAMAGCAAVLLAIAFPVAFHLEARDKRARERSSHQQQPPSGH